MSTATTTNMKTSMSAENSPLEYKRVPKHKPTGMGAVLAVIQVCAFFYFVPDLLKEYYPRFVKWMDKNGYDLEFYAPLIAVGNHYTFMLLSNLFGWFLYRIEHPFIEKYKTNDLPWPWYSDPNGWKEMIAKSLKLCFFNNFVVLPIFVANDYYLDQN